MPTVTYAEYAAQHPEFIQRVAQARNGAAKLWCELQDATGRSRQRGILHRYLTSFDVRLEAMYKGVRDTKQFHRFPPPALLAAAEALDLFEACSEPVRRSAIERDGKRRPIISFGPLARARQHVAADALRAVHNPHPLQLTRSGRVPGALRALEQAFRDGCIYGQEVDVVSFFPSIHFDGLVTTLRPLPRAVVENVVWSRVNRTGFAGGSNS